MTIELTKEQIQVIQFALMQLRLSTEQSSVSSSDKSMAEYIRDVEINFLNSTNQ